MGEAKRRGNFEERRRPSLEREHHRASEAARLAQARREAYPPGALAAAVLALGKESTNATVMPRQNTTIAAKYRRGAQRGR